MARTITVMDDDSGVVTTVVVDKNAEGLSSVKEIRFTGSNGVGLGELDLSILRDFGLVDATPALPAPQPAPPPAAAPEAETAADAPARGPARRPAKLARGGKKGRSTDRLGRGYRRAPDVTELQRLFAEHGGPSAIARALDVPVYSVQGWLRRFRSEGHDFPTG